MQASNLQKTHSLLRLNPSHACIKPAQTSPTPASESFSHEHQTCTNLTNSCVWILLMQAFNLQKPQPLLHLIPSHTSIKPAQTSSTLASESFSCFHQTCANLILSCVSILIMRASNLHKPHPLLCLNPSQTSIKPAQTSLPLASESFSCMHLTCTNLNHSCIWFLLIQAANLNKPHPLLPLDPSHASIKPAQTSRTPASESFSCMHLTCTNLNHSCIWFLLIQAANLNKPHPLLRLNPSHACKIPVQTSPTLAFESFSYKHQTCKKLTHSCVWILLMLASNLHKPHPLLPLDPSHASIKPAQTSRTPASESFSCMHLTCTNLNHSCIWFLLIQAANLNKPHPLLRLNPSHAFNKPAQTSPFPASQSLSYKHQTFTNLTHSCVWILPMRAKNLHKHHTRLRLNLYHACIKLAQTSSTPASESLSCVHQTFTNLTHSCVWILVMRASDLHKPRPHLRLNPSHTSIKPAQTSNTPVSQSLSFGHQTCTNLTHTCVWILLIQASNLHKAHTHLRLNTSHTSTKPACPL